MFRTILYQLLSQVPSASTDFKGLYEEKRKFQGDIRKDWEWHEPELRRILKSSLISAARTHNIVIFVDALDEAGEVSAKSIVTYLHEVNELLLNSKHTTRICFSCRHFPIIRTSNGVQICLEDENYEDISTYVLAELRRQILSRDHKLGSDDLNLLQTRILSKASGVFLWAVLVIPMIAKQYNEGRALKEILEGLEKAPSDLGTIYKHMLTLADPTAQGRTLHLMQWICFAERPLSLTELRFALALDDSSVHRFQESAQESIGFVESDMRMKDIVVSLSGGLAEVVELHKDRHDVQFIHQSVSDFLFTDGFRWLDQDSAGNPIGRGHDRLSRSCVNYFKLGEVQRVANSDSSTIIADLPFLKYATESWFLHAEKAESWNIPQDDLIRRFQWPSSQYFTDWIKIFRKIDRYNSRRPLVQTTLMHLAAASNLGSIVKALLESGTFLEVGDDEGNKALHYAARWGHKQIVSILLGADANIHARNAAQLTPLERAAAGSHVAVVELLLEKGAEVNCQTGESGSALQSAAINGSLITVRLLLENGADINAQGGEYSNALQVAAARGSEAIVELLLDRGADIDAQGGLYGNALQAVAYKGHQRAARILTNRHVDVNRKDFQGRLALHFAMRGNRLNMIEYLLSMGARADWTHTDQQGRSALHFAASGGSVQAVKLVLSSGIDINISDTDGWTPLHWACRNGDVDTVRLLADSGANLQSKNTQGQAPLDVAIFCSNGSLIPTLSLFNKSIDTEAKQHAPALGIKHNTCCNSCLHVSRILIPR
jgi:ankyrin repeat protein